MAAVNLSTLFRNKLGNMSLESISGLQTALNAKLDKASLSNAIDSTSSVNAATSKAAKTAYDKAIEAFNKAVAAQASAGTASGSWSNLPNAKSDQIDYDTSDCLATSKAVKYAYDRGTTALSTANVAATNANNALNKWSNLPNAKSDSVSTASSDVLATSMAVKSAYDLANQANNTANSAAGGESRAKSYADGLFANRSDSVSSTSSTTLATSKAVYDAYNRQHSTLYYGGVSKVDSTSAGAVINGTLNVTSSITAAGNVTAYSDRSLKEDIVPLSGALDIIDRLNGYRYKWKATKRASLGVIAQELREVLPELVFDNDGILSVDYTLLTAVLIEAVKELKQKLEK